MGNPVITLTTDFGTRDPYVAEMKGAVLGISPNARIVDLTHQIEKFNVRMAAYVLALAHPYFPKNTIHVAVVDPTVGTRRKPIIVKTEKCCFVGPDNGVLALAVRIANSKSRIFTITNSEFMLPTVSNTFHGRDIFAPAAAHLANGVEPAKFGPEIHQIESPEFARIISRKNEVIGRIIHLDDFGNIITSFTEKDLETPKTTHEMRITVGKVKLLLRLCKAYGDVKKQQPLALIGSHGFLEISVNQGNAARVFKARVGDKVVIPR